MERGGAEHDEPRFLLEPLASVTYSDGPRWVVKGLLAAQGLAVIYGPPKAFKSFIALDVALAIATGRTWAGRRVSEGVVVYICAEAASAFADRVAANRIHRRIPDDSPFYLVRARPNLGMVGGDAHALIDAIDEVVQPTGLRVAAVFIDTLVRTLGGAAENDIGMANFIDGAEVIADAFGCLAIAIHHTGKDATRGMRGSSALHGAVVSSWRVEKVGPRQARVTLEDAKDGESGLSWCAELERCAFRIDEDGDEESVLLVAAVGSPGHEGSAADQSPNHDQKRGRPPAQLRLFLSCLDDAMAAVSREEQTDEGGPPLDVVTLRTVRDAYFVRRGDDAKAEAKRKSFDNQVRAAMERRLIGAGEVRGVKVLWKM